MHTPVQTSSSRTTDSPSSLRTANNILDALVFILIMSSCLVKTSTKVISSPGTSPRKDTQISRCPPVTTHTHSKSPRPKTTMQTIRKNSPFWSLLKTPAPMPFPPCLHRSQSLTSWLMRQKCRSCRLASQSSQYGAIGLLLTMCPKTVTCRTILFTRRMGSMVA
jgi:hypothetical protein